MNEIIRIRIASVIIFLLPLLAINLGLSFNNYIFLYSIDNHKFIIFLYDKLPILEQIHLDALEKHYLFTKLTFPYIDGEVSISAAVRGYYTNYFIFKPLIFSCCIFMLLYWYNYKNFLNKVIKTKKPEINYFFIVGVFSAIFLFLHAYFLGRPDWKELYDVTFYRLFRRFIIISFILLELTAQFLLVIKLTKIRKSIDHLVKQKVLSIKLFFSIFLIALTILTALTMSVVDHNYTFNNIVEWNYFPLLLTYFLLSFFMWKKTQKPPAYIP